MKILAICEKIVIAPLFEINGITITEVDVAGHFWRKDVTVDGEERNILDGGICFNKDLKYKAKSDQHRTGWVIECSNAFTHNVRNLMGNMNSFIDLESINHQNKPVYDIKNRTREHTGVFLDDSNSISKPPVAAATDGLRIPTYHNWISKYLRKNVMTA